MSRAVRSSVLAALAVSAVTPAHAQAWVGQMAGQMQAQQAEAERDRDCMHGAPADPDDVQRTGMRVEKAMTAYFALTRQSSPREISGLFATDKKDVAWRDTKGTVPLGDLGPRLSAPAPQRTLIALVVGGDARTARAIWSVAPAAGVAQMFYAGDFIDEGLFGGGWKIWHLAVLPTQPDVPAAYCHFDPEQGF